MRGIEQYLQVDAATLGALKYQGTWNASTNTPTLTSSVGVQGQYYVVSVAGSTNLNGETNWGVGDWAVFNGSVWQKVDGGSTGLLTTLTVTGDTYLATTSGNTGIGTSSVTAIYGKTLQIGSGASESSVSLVGSSGAVYLATVGATGQLIARGGASLVLGTNDVEKVRVDTSGNVGIGTTTPSSYAKLTVWGGNVWAQSVTAGVGARITLSDTNNLSWIDSAPSGGASNMAFATSGVEKMRLDAFGNLGLGTTSPASKLHVSGSGDISRFTNGSVTLFGYSDSQGLGWFTGAGGTGVGVYYNHSNNYQGFYTASAEKMRLDSSGNLGLGVTPSAWISSYRALNIGDSGLLSSRTGASINNVELGVNWFRNSAGSFVYKANGYGTNYQQFDGAHYWYNAPSGTAGNAISFTQAMTLDASGNLLVGTTSSAYATSGRGLAEINGSSTALIAIKTSDTARGYFAASSTVTELSAVGASQPLIFTVNGAERLRITSAGNIHTPAGATTMTNGFFYIPAAAGVPSGVPTAITGTVPMYYDTTNNKFYVYNGAWKSVALL